MNNDNDNSSNLNEPVLSLKNLCIQQHTLKRRQ